MLELIIKGVAVCYFITVFFACYRVIYNDAFDESKKKMWKALCLFLSPSAFYYLIAIDTDKRIKIGTIAMLAVIVAGVAYMIVEG